MLQGLPAYKGCSDKLSLGDRPGFEGLSKLPHLQSQTPRMPS